jgi:hypothetical protein
VTGLTITRQIHFRNGGHRRKHLREGEAPQSAVPAGRIPRVSRLMALAIRMEGIVRDGRVPDYAELARVGHVSRARVTQILNLLSLAPDIQEQILFLPAVERGRDPISERDLRPIAAVLDWRKQRRMWLEIRRFLT